MVRLLVAAFMLSSCSFAHDLASWALNQNFDERDIRMHKRFEISCPEAIIDQIDIIHKDQGTNFHHTLFVRIWTTKNLDRALKGQIKEATSSTKYYANNFTQEQEKMMWAQIELTDLAKDGILFDELLQVIGALSQSINIELKDDVKNALLELKTFNYLSPESRDNYRPRASNRRG